MLDPDELYFGSERYRDLLDRIGIEIEEEDSAQRAGNWVEASQHGLQVWRCLLDLMALLEAKSVYEVAQAQATIYDLLHWATCFADALSQAARTDKSFESHRLEFCQSYVDMHHGMLDKEAYNLGNVRATLAECYYVMGKTEKVDSLFREWLRAEPDWGWGWIAWSDLYWLWNLGREKDFDKAEKILQEGLSTRRVRDREHLEERLENLKAEKGERSIQPAGPGDAAAPGDSSKC